MSAATTRSNKFNGPGTTIPQSIDETVTPNAAPAGSASSRTQDFKRDVYKRTPRSTWARHDIKVGVDCEHDQAVNQQLSTAAPASVIYKLSTSGGVIYYRHRYLRQRSRAGLRPRRSDRRGRSLCR